MMDRSVGEFPAQHFASGLRLVTQASPRATASSILGGERERAPGAGNKISFKTGISVCILRPRFVLYLQGTCDCWSFLSLLELLYRFVRESRLIAAFYRLRGPNSMNKPWTLRLSAIAIVAATALFAHAASAAPTTGNAYANQNVNVHIDGQTHEKSTCTNVGTLTIWIDGQSSFDCSGKENIVNITHINGKSTVNLSQSSMSAVTISDINGQSIVVLGPVSTSLNIIHMDGQSTICYQGTPTVTQGVIDGQSVIKQIAAGQDCVH
jgi:hypothetical protein